MSFYDTLLGIVPTAFFLSFGHCLGMCGGFVIAYNSKLSKFPKLKAFYYSLAYHISRVFAYVLFGAFGGYFGSIFSISSKLMGYTHFLIGIFLVILGISLIFRGEFLKFIENASLWRKFLAKPTKFAMSQNSFSSFILLGFLNGLMPCGIVYTFLATAIISASVVHGATIMLVFGLSTVPTMVGLSFITNLLTQKFKLAMLYLSAIIIIFFGIYHSYMGFMATR